MKTACHGEDCDTNSRIGGRIQVGRLARRRDRATGERNEVPVDDAAARVLAAVRG